MRRCLAFATIAIATMVAVAVPAVHAQLPPVEALSVRASVDNERPYLGQQITYSLRIYQNKDADLSSIRVRYDPPGFAGFWNSQQTRQDEYDETIGDSEYRVVEVRTVLFASVVGTGDIEPAVLEVSTGAPGTSGRLESSTIAMQVRPLPAPQPDGFTGAVGRFDISASVDATDGRLNEPVLLTVEISGEGNIEALPDPHWPEFVGWRVIESPANDESQVVAGRITGSRTYEIALMPEQARELTIPEIRYPYFDPALERYVDLVTAPIAVSVADADGSPAVPSLPAVERPDKEAAEARPIKSVPPTLRHGGTELSDSTVYWAAWAIPALTMAAAVAWRRRRSLQVAARAETLRNRALPEAQSALARAVVSGADPRVAASEAVLSYLNARLDGRVMGLTREALIHKVRDAGVSSDLEGRIGELLAAGESAKYTPLAGGASGTGGYTERASRLLTELEEAINA